MNQFFFDKEETLKNLLYKEEINFNTKRAQARQKTGGAAGLWGEGFFCLDFLVLFDQAKST
ncbi:hypothetical protein, partial [Cyclobacterium sp.]|uniref:hypothetical protein n=1 Tax=Cyclobacterium sp. TaxID=1966343 RepID=UPI0025C02A06